MHKRFVSFIIIIAICLGTSFAPAAAAVEGLSNFEFINQYTEGQFKDVLPNDWFAANVELGVRYGLINGTSATTFSPNNYLRISEAIKIADCIHSIYYTGSANFEASSPWYQTYVDYALKNGIIGADYKDYSAYITRKEFARILANSLPDEALAAINKVDDDAVPDVKTSDTYGPAVYKLYRAGILTGNDKQGTFSPNSYILRKEVAAIATRMVDPGLRRSVTLSSSSVLSAEDLYAKCSPAVFYIEVYDRNNYILGTGSGFFVTSTGVAVTNYHVIEGASSAVIRTSTGEQFGVKGVYDYSEELDLALLQIDGSGFAYLEIGDSKNLSTGATIYTIGSPLGLENTMSVGIISNANRILDGSRFIQISAPISPGSSGGALLNTAGKVIGITSALFVQGQNLNLAIPIDLIANLDQNSGMVQLSSLMPAAKLTMDKDMVSIERGKSAVIMISENVSEYITIQFTVRDSSIVSCSWGEWIDYTSIPLTIYGLSSGTTSILIELLDDYDNVLASSTITVYVTASSTSYYYEGYYPVPDYGSFAGAPVFRKFTTSTGTSYYYRLIDLPSDAGLTVEGYVDLLLSNGFSYSTGFVSDEGYTVVVYTNPTYELDVFFSLSDLLYDTCIVIMIIPY